MCCAVDLLPFSSGHPDFSRAGSRLARAENLLRPGRWFTSIGARRVTRRGRGNPGTQSLQLKYGGKTPAVLVERTDLAPEAVAVFVRQGVLLMAPFRKTEITDAELKALTAYVAKNFKAP
ncbi:MAG: cytochrome c [Gammaproteobacteria bacterium]